MKISKSGLSIAMLNAGVDTFKQLAEKTGLSVNTLSRLNNGAAPMVSTVRKLAVALDCDPADIIEGV